VKSFSFVQEQASTLAPKVDALLLAVAGLTLFVAVAVTVTVIYFGIKYRRGHDVNRELPPPRQLPRLQRRLELVWIFVPLALFIAVFVWGADLYFDHYAAPDGAQPIFVVAKQWMWKLEHPDGRREINELHVARGTAVKLIMTSQDVIHSFFVPAFRIKQDVLPGRYTIAWFHATRPGTYHLFCAEYCGTQHSGMIGDVVVMEPAQYEAWLSGGTAGAPLAVTGKNLFTQLGCSTCHLFDTQGRGPNLAKVFGSKVLLEDGRTLVADENYVRESIVSPGSKIVSGFKPIMPTFQGLISDDQLNALVAYVKSLSQQQSGQAAGTVAGTSPQPNKQQVQ